MWRTSPTSWPSVLRSRQSTQSCGASPRLRAGGTVKESSTFHGCSAQRTLLPGWSWPNSATREAQSCSSNMMVRVLHYHVSPNAFGHHWQKTLTLNLSFTPLRCLWCQARWRQRWWSPFWGTSPVASAWILEVSVPQAAWCLSCPGTPACPASTCSLPPQTPQGMSLFKLRIPLDDKPQLVKTTVNTMLK